MALFELLQKIQFISEVLACNVFLVKMVFFLHEASQLCTFLSYDVLLLGSLDGSFLCYLLDYFFNHRVVFGHP